MKTKRWNDAAADDDGTRILICRYRPRGVRNEAETWHTWLPQFGPSRELHADYYGKHGPPIDWVTYRTRYLAEMQNQRGAIARLAARVAAGETITLLCSSACIDAERCHRTLLRGLVEQQVARALDQLRNEGAGPLRAGDPRRQPRGHAGDL